MDFGKGLLTMGLFLFHGYNYRIRLIRNTFKKINIHGLFFYANLASLILLLNNDPCSFFEF